MNTRKLALWLILVLMSAPLAALDGVVLSATGDPLPGGQGPDTRASRSAVAGPDGRFHFDWNPTPPFDVLISRPDGVALRPIHVAALPTGLLELRIAPVLAEEVTVISGSAPDIELPLAAAFTLSGRADLDQRAPVQLYEVLEIMPRAGRVGDGLAAVPSLRGLAQSRTLILLDEGRVSAERRAGPSATFLDPATVDEVEVVRGPGSVAYGSDAFGGIIRSAPASRARASRCASAITWPPLTPQASCRVVSRCRRQLSGVAWSPAFSRRHFDDYESPSGVVPLSGGEGRSARLGYQHELAGGALRFLWRTDIARDVGKPAIDSAVTRTLYPEETSHRLSIQYDRGPTAGFSRLSLAATLGPLPAAHRQGCRSHARRSHGRSPAPTSRRTTGDFAWRPNGRSAQTRIVVGFDGSGRLGLSAVNDTHQLRPWQPVLRDRSQPRGVDRGRQSQ